MNDTTTVVGIDLGTTYSCLAYLNESGEPVVQTNLEGQLTTPSVVHFDPDDPSKYDVGQVAKDNAVIDPTRTAELAKRFMGTGAPVLEVDGKKYSPEEVSAFILKKLASDATQLMPMKFDGCVVTVPAYFGDAEKRATKAAAEIAGLNLYGLVQEPVAAAINYGCDRTDKDEVVAVYDLGGGTFDVSIVSITHGADGSTDICVVRNDGDRILGGSNWDDVIFGYLENEYREKSGYDDEFDEYAQQEFRLKAEKLKKELTNKASSSVALNLTGKPIKITLSVDDFEEMTASLLERTIDTMRSCVDLAKSENGCEVQRILLVGGSTRMPQVAKRLQEEFPNLPIEINEPDEAVAKGAARFAAQLAAGIQEKTADGDLEDAFVEVVNQETNEVEKHRAVGENNVVLALAGPGGAKQRISVQTVTSKSYGVKVVVQGSLEEKISNLIIKNRRIDPVTNCFEVTKTFGTLEDNQPSVEITVYENDLEEELVDIDSEPLATAEISFEGMSLPAGSPINVTFALNDEGTLDVKAVEASSGRDCKLTLTVSGILTEEEIQEARKAVTAMTMID